MEAEQAFMLSKKLDNMTTADRQQSLQLIIAELESITVWKERMVYGKSETN